MSPRSHASAAVIGRPVSSSSTASGRGSRRGSQSTPPESGMMPSPVSGSRKSACSAATTRSAASASSKPPPAAMPLTAAMTGLARPCSSVSPAKPPRPWSAPAPSPAAAALRSQPAQKNRSPAAVTIPARRSGSPSRRANASYKARLVAASIALAGGRSSVISSTPPDASVRTGGRPAPGSAPPPGAISGAPLAEHRARDDVPLNLAGPVPDPLDPGVAPEPLDREVAHEAHAAEDLHRLVGDPAEHLRGVQLGHRGVGVAHPALVEPAGGAEGEEFGGLDLGRHVGEAEADALEPPDRLPELLAGGRPPSAQVQHPPGPPHAGGRHREPARPEPLTQQVEPVALGT